MKNLTPERIEDLIRLLSENQNLRPFLEDAPLSSVGFDPWESNYAAVTRKDNESFCREIAKLIGEGDKIPKSVALMRSLDDPLQKIDQFHNIHIDSRFSDKTLIVVKGDESYTVFTDTDWSQFSFAERVELLIRQLVAELIEKLKLTSLQFKYTNFLPARLTEKAYKKKNYNAIPGTVIKFNNMLPHHSHRRPTKFTVVLQVVYS